MVHNCFLYVCNLRKKELKFWLHMHEGRCITLAETPSVLKLFCLQKLYSLLCLFDRGTDRSHVTALTLLSVPEYR